MISLQQNAQVQYTGLVDLPAIHPCISIFVRHLKKVTRKIFFCFGNKYPGVGVYEEVAPIS
jgi:hypothetical protein